MLVRGKIAGNKASVPFTARKDKKGVEIKVDFLDEEFTYSVDCPCLEPLELFGLLLPSLRKSSARFMGCSWRR